MYREDEIFHGRAHRRHKYIARVPKRSGGYRYFYDKKEYESYLRYKSGAAVETVANAATQTGNMFAYGAKNNDALKNKCAKILNSFDNVSIVDAAKTVKRSKDNLRSIVNKLTASAYLMSDIKNVADKTIAKTYLNKDKKRR